MPSRCQIQETFRDAGRLASDLPVHAAHLRAELGLPLPDHLLRVLLLEQVHETHGERAAGARDCVDVPPKNDVSAEGKETLTGASWHRPEIWLSVFEVGSERTARSSVFRVSQPVQHAGAHSRGSAGELAIPHAARRAPESSDPARAAPLRGRTPRTLKYHLRAGFAAPRTRGDPTSTDARRLTLATPTLPTRDHRLSRRPRGTFT